MVSTQAPSSVREVAGGQKPKRPTELEKLFQLLPEWGEFLEDCIWIEAKEIVSLYQLFADWKRVKREADTLAKLNPSLAARYESQLSEANDKIFAQLKSEVPQWKKIGKYMRDFR